MGNEARKPATLFFLLSIFTILTFLWRFFVPAHEQNETNLLIDFEILFEVVTVFALIFLFSHLRSRYGGSQSALATTFWVALVASVGILFMRFSSDESWYTGHRVYQPGYGAPSESSARSADPTRQLYDAATAISAELPKKVDDVTTLTRVEYGHEVFTYYYDIAPAGYQSPNWSTEALNAKVKTFSCKTYKDYLGTPALKTVQYIFKMGIKGVSVEIGAMDCQL